MESGVKVFSCQGIDLMTVNIDGVVYVNVTQLAKAFGKRPNDYMRGKSAVDLIRILSKRVNYDLYKTVVGGDIIPYHGTWLCSMLAVDFVRWLSVDCWAWMLSVIDSGGFSFDIPAKNALLSEFGGDKVFTYIARDRNGRYKIGKTSDLPGREGHCRVSNIDFEIIYYVDGDMEKMLHEKFSDKRIKREWFSFSEEELDELVESHGFEKFY